MREISDRNQFLLEHLVPYLKYKLSLNEVVSPIQHLNKNQFTRICLEKKTEKKNAKRCT